jgi:hypothetical protein
LDDSSIDLGRQSRLYWQYIYCIICPGLSMHVIIYI